MTTCSAPNRDASETGDTGGAGDNSSSIPFNDLATLHSPLLPSLHRLLTDVVKASAFVGGPWLARFEEQWAQYCGVRHAVGVANGTEAIELVLRGLGVGRGDEVIVPANTFVATAAAVVAVGATPVFVDVDPGTLLITPSGVLSAIGPNTAAVIVVHLFGQMADVDAILAIANSRGITVIEDAAQAHGARRAGSRAGSIGRAGTFSFYPGKNLGALGDGGAVVTDDAALADRVRMLGNHGRDGGQGVHVEVGRNSRLDGLQAAFLSEKLATLDEDNNRRRSVAGWYRQRLADLPIQFLEIDDSGEPVHHLLVAQVERRDRFRRRLGTRGIETSIHYPIPCHRQPAFERFGHGYLPVVERAAARLVSLPIFPAMDEDTVDQVCQAIQQVLTSRGGER